MPGGRAGTGRWGSSVAAVARAPRASAARHRWPGGSAAAAGRVVHAASTCGRDARVSALGVFGGEWSARVRRMDADRLGGARLSSRWAQGGCGRGSGTHGAGCGAGSGAGAWRAPRHRLAVGQYRGEVGRRRRPVDDELDDDGSARDGAAAAALPRGVEPRPLVADAPPGGPSRQVVKGRRRAEEACSAMVLARERQGASEVVSCSALPVLRHPRQSGHQFRLLRPRRAPNQYWAWPPRGCIGLATAGRPRLPPRSSRQAARAQRGSCARASRLVSETRW